MVLLSDVTCQAKPVSYYVPSIADSLGEGGRSIIEVLLLIMRKEKKSKLRNLRVFGTH